MHDKNLKLIVTSC